MNNDLYNFYIPTYLTPFQNNNTIRVLTIAKHLQALTFTGNQKLTPHFSHGNIFLMAMQEVF